MSLRLRAPASTANIGPGFDCAAAALDLWNELELEQDGGDPDLGHLGVQAFSRLAATDGWSFSFTDAIPRERGLGSSASIAPRGRARARRSSSRWRPAGCTSSIWRRASGSTARRASGRS